MIKLNALHNLFCEDMTYQEYWEQIRGNGEYTAMKELIKELNLYALLRIYKYETSPVIQEYVENELKSRILKKYK